MTHHESALTDLLAALKADDGNDSIREVALWASWAFQAAR